METIPSMVWSGRTYVTADVMMSRTGDCLGLHHQQRADVLVRHQLDGVEHGGLGRDGLRGNGKPQSEMP